MKLWLVAGQTRLEACGKRNAWADFSKEVYTGLPGLSAPEGTVGFIVWITLFNNFLFSNYIQVMVICIHCNHTDEIKKIGMFIPIQNCWYAFYACLHILALVFAFYLMYFCLGWCFCVYVVLGVPHNTSWILGKHFISGTASLAPFNISSTYFPIQFL